jgi:hypothetical protein
MSGENLSDQLRRIGGLAAAAVILGAAFAVFAVMRRIVPASTSTPTPAAVVPLKTRILAAPVSAAAASAVSGTGVANSTDPLAVSQAQTARALARSQRQEMTIVRRQRAAVRRGIAASARSLHHERTTTHRAVVRAPGGAAVTESAHTPKPSPNSASTTKSVRSSEGQQ